jgi:tetratricopeptide (TPR) repeat protein
MPTTVNGVGTHYYGQRNVETRHAECRVCGHVNQLTSYDTRLCFVVLFIPIIPLGRKRIIDQCGNCRRHFAANADEWETARQLNVSGAQAKFEESPTPEAAMELHQTMLNFHQTSEAAKFRSEMAQRFRDDAKVHVYLGDALSNVGNAKEAAAYYNRALELRPDLPAARIGVAYSQIAAGKLDEARSLLDFLEKPGAAQLYPLGSLETLADAYQRKGRHEAALELYGRLLAEIPAAGQFKLFRRKVNASEKALGRQGASILPKRQWSWRDLFRQRNPRPDLYSKRLSWRGLAVFGILAACVVIGLAIGNEYVRRHRVVYIVGGLPEKAHVSIDGVGAVDVRSGMEQTLVLPEGHYKARISGAVTDEFEFDIRADYIDRWSDKPVWLINVGGTAVLYENRVTYSLNPPPATTALHFGNRFEYILNVSHPFKTLPETVKMKSGETRVLANLELWKGDTNPLVQQLLFLHREDDAMNLAEWHLTQAPGNEDAVNSYVAAAVLAKKVPRAVKFLEAGLRRQPVNIQWHRSYTGLAREPGLEGRLAALYDEMLQARPDDSAILYLRGRVETKPHGKSAWFERSIARDRNNPYPYYAMGSGGMPLAEWERARPLLARAVELRPNDSQFDEALFLTRLALKETPELEAELNAKLKAGPPNVVNAVRLIEVLLVQGRRIEAKRIAEENVRMFARFGADGQPAQDAVSRFYLYASGGFEELARQTAKDRTLAGRMTLFAAQLELGQPAAASALLAREDGGGLNSYNTLAVSLGFRLAGDESGAKQWEDRAIAQLELGDCDDRSAAAMLRSVEPPSDEALASYFSIPRDKALLCAVLAAKHPSRRAAFAEWAARLNVRIEFPHHLVVRAVAGGGPGR